MDTIEITDAQIEQLRDEMAVAGDQAMVAICDGALHGFGGIDESIIDELPERFAALRTDRRAFLAATRAECARVIAAAAAMLDE